MKKIDEKNGKFWTLSNNMGRRIDGGNIDDLSDCRCDEYDTSMVGKTFRGLMSENAKLKAENQRLLDKIEYINLIMVNSLRDSCTDACKETTECDDEKN